MNFVFNPKKHVIFEPLNKEKYKGNVFPIARSSWEQNFYRWCDLNNSVTSWVVEGLAIEYFDKVRRKKRKYYPDVKKYIYLTDDSGFSWRDSRGKSYKTNFLKGYLLIHRKTWYEDKFGATMCDEDAYKLYREKANKNFDDPSKKPDKFNFIMKILN